MKKYLRHRVSNLITINEIFVLEYRKDNGKFSKDVDFHNFWEIVYVESGLLKCNIEGKNIILNENSIMFLKPNTQHSYNQRENSKVFCIGFECLSSWIRPLHMQILQTTEKQRSILQDIINENASTFFLNEQEQLIRFKKQPFGCMQIIMLLLEHLLFLSLRDIIDASNPSIFFLPDKKFEETLAEQIKLFCFEHVKDKISLKDICRHLGYSQSFLCNLFKKQTNKTIFQYYNELKIEEAKKLLTQTNMSSVEISYMLMYNDIKYFNTDFKKSTGLPPIAYRKQHKKINKE